MKFKEIIKYAKDVFCDFKENDIYTLIYFLSKKVKSKSDLILNYDEIVDFDIQNFLDLINKNINKQIPIEYLTHLTNFCNLTFYINKDVLIPRSETEWLVNTLIKKYVKKHDLKIMDLCSGSGCIGLTLKKFFPQADVTLLEKYTSAINVINRNIKQLQLKVSLIQDDVVNFIKNTQLKYDLVVCNPPYVSISYPIDDYCKKEPKHALFAPNDGLYYIEKLIEYNKNILNHDGLLIIEIGFDQANKIRKYLEREKVRYHFEKDFNDIERYLIITN